MPVYETTVQSVTQRLVNTRDGRTSTVYDIVDGAGNKWATFKQPIATEANRLIGHQVELTGRIETNEKGYTNYIIDDIRLGTGAQQRAADIPVAPPSPVEQAMRAQAVSTAPHQNIPQSDTEEKKDWKIARQTAAKVSAQISGDPVSFWQNLDALVQYFIYGTKPAEFSHFPAPPRDFHEPQPNQFIPEAAIAADPGPEFAVSHTDDDIPF